MPTTNRPGTPGCAAARFFPLLKFLAGMLALYYSAYALWGARIPVANGFGWDGQLYAAFAQDFFGMLRRHGVDSYHTNRLLPSFIIWCIGTLFGINLTIPANVIWAFHVYNGTLLVVGALIWSRIARWVSMNFAIGLIGFMSLFVNWAVIEFYPFYAVLTDVTALFLGITAALAVVERRYFLLTGVAFTASFAWNAIFPFCSLLVLFSRPGEVPLCHRWMPAAAVAAAILIAIILALSGFQPIGEAEISNLALPIS